MELEKYRGYYKSILNDKREFKILYDLEFKLLKNSTFLKCLVSKSNNINSNNNNNNNKRIFIMITINPSNKFKYLSKYLNMNSFISAAIIFSDSSKFIEDFNNYRSYYLLNIDYNLLLDNIIKDFPVNFSSYYTDLTSLGVRSLKLIKYCKINQIYDYEN